jgi:hypothetical protein
MIIVGTFKHSIELEQSLAVLENSFIAKEQILVVFMDDAPAANYLYKKDIQSNAFEIGIGSATGSAVIGACIGFVLNWGPIIWGLIAAFIGFAIGYGIYCFSKKNMARINLPKKIPDVTIIIQCTENQSNEIKEVLWKYQALTVGKIDEPSNKQSNE